MMTFLSALLISMTAPDAPLPTLRVATVQLEVSSVMMVNLEKMIDSIDAAAAEDARVVVFPETALSGFSAETIASIDWAALADGQKQIAAAALKHGVYVIYGSATANGEDKPLNSAILVNPEGEEFYQYDKMVPESWFTPGDHLALFEIDGVAATLVICHDERYPELTRIPVMGGARILFYISYEINDLESAQRKVENYRGQLIGRAAENQIWVIQSNGITPEAERNGKASLGHSRIVTPGGNVLEEAPELKPAMLIHDINPNHASRGNALKSMQIGPLADWWAEGVRLLHRDKSGSDLVSTD